MMTKNNTEWVDYAKGIGIVLVVYGHVARGLHNSGIAVPRQLYSLTDSIIYSFHMPLFFFLSGLFFYQSFAKRGAKKLILSKIDTLVYPYIIWSFLQGGIEVYLSNHTNRSTTISDVLTFWVPRGHFWYLYALVAFFAVASLFFTLFQKKYSSLLLTATTVLYLSKKFIPEQTLPQLISGFMVFFSLGIAFMTHPKLKIPSSPPWLAIYSLIFFLSQWIYHKKLLMNYNNTGIESLLLAIISILFLTTLSFNLSRTPNRVTKTIITIGSSSMAIYILHIICASGSRIILNEFFHLSSPSLHLLLGCTAGIAIPLIIKSMLTRWNIPYAFSAPLSTWLTHFYNRVLTK